MNYMGCSVINDSFVLGSDGSLWCSLDQSRIEDSVIRAYIFTNLFFYDATETEIQKLIKKINKQKDVLLASTNIEPNATELIYPQLSNMIEGEFKTEQLDPLLKLELSKIKPHISLDLTPTEKETVTQIKESILYSEIEKFKRDVFIIDDNMAEEKEVMFSKEYIESLSRRAKRLFNPSIKMVALFQGLSFDEFNMDADYNLKYRWSRKRSEFNEEEIKDKIKDIIRKATENKV